MYSTNKINKMIQPGQKLKEGDYFQGGTREQYKELLEIENMFGVDHDYIEYANECVIHEGIHYSSEVLFDLSASPGNGLITEYDFTDFKQLCENTFGDGK